MIKVLITDGKGTLFLPGGNEDVQKLVTTLGERGIQLAVASNDQTGPAPIVQVFRDAGLPDPAAVVTRGTVGAPKPAPVFVEAIAATLGVERHEIAFLGDDDRTDIFCAVNAGVLPMMALYSPDRATKKEYGLPFRGLSQVQEFLSTYGGHDGPYFGWTAGAAPLGQEFKALVGDMRRKRSSLELVFKHHKDIREGTTKVPVQGLMFYYLISQVFLSGLSNEANWVTLYPGHSAGATSPTLSYFLKYLVRTFSRRFIPNLLVRHTTAPKSQYQGDQRNIYSQFATLNVNPAYREKIIGQTVLVVDDFSTRGFSLETARTMLLKAGASRVVGLAIAKFSNDQAIATVKGDWDPFVPFTLGPDAVSVRNHKGTFHRASDAYFWDRIWGHYVK